MRHSHESHVCEGWQVLLTSEKVLLQSIDALYSVFREAISDDFSINNIVVLKQLTTTVWSIQQTIMFM